MSKVIKLRDSFGDVVERKARRIHRKNDNLEYGWVSLDGRDVKVVRGFRKRIWDLVS